MKFVDDFDSFIRKVVNLNQNRLDTLQARVDAINSFLESSEEFGEIFIELIPAGSWAHNSIIKPVGEFDEFDADVLLHVQERSEWLPKDYIEELYRTFRGSTVYNSLAQRKTRCVRIDYANDFHIDVVPYIEQSGFHYITNHLDPEGVGKFEASNPEAFNIWIDDRQRFTKGSFIKVIRLLKYLRDFKNTFTCKSIILTTLIGEQINEIEASLSPHLYDDVPSLLNTVLDKLATSLPETMPDVMDPAGTGDNFSARYSAEWDYENFRKQIIRYAGKVKDAYQDEDRESSIAKWQDIFGDEFKPGTLEKVSALAPLSATIPWAGEMFIEKSPFNFPTIINPHYRIRILGKCIGYSDGQTIIRKGFRQFNISTQGNRVSKNRRLLFLANTDVPPPYTVFWKVRNGGQEALNVGQLRGEIIIDGGNNSRGESTLYKGTHYVECYIVKNNIVVAKDRQKVIVT